MRFSLKWALTAVLAKGIVAEVTHMAHTQKLPNEMDIVSQKQSEFQPHYRQAVQPESVEIGPSKIAYSAYQQPESYVAQPDPIQQYVTSYNPEKGIKAEPSDQFTTYLEPAGFAEYSGAANGAYNPGTFAVQSGYEGYLVPGPPEFVAVQPVKEVSIRQNLPAFMDPIVNTVSSITRGLPGSLSFIMGLMGATMIGGGVTAAICTFTPLCTISFALPFAGLRRGLKEIARSYVGPENAEMLDKAIVKFTSMEAEERAKSVAKSDAGISDTDIKVDVDSSLKADLNLKADSSDVPAPSPKAIDENTSKTDSNTK